MIMFHVNLQGCNAWGIPFEGCSAGSVGANKVVALQLPHHFIPRHHRRSQQKTCRRNDSESNVEVTVIRMFR